jgi:hypothetical protein
MVDVLKTLLNKKVKVALKGASYYVVGILVDYDEDFISVTPDDMVGAVPISYPIENVISIREWLD